MARPRPMGGCPAQCLAGDGDRLRTASLSSLFRRRARRVPPPRAGLAPGALTAPRRGTCSLAAVLTAALRGSDRGRGATAESAADASARCAMLAV
jgi:hypothetical protein